MQPTENIDLLFQLYQEQKAESEKRFFNFFINAWPTLETRWGIDLNWHVGLIGEHLEAVADNEIEKLVVNIPTRYLKSLICTVAFPAWAWQRDPRKKFIFSSYADSLSSSLSWKRRLLIESFWYQNHWGRKVQMAPDQNQKTLYANQAGGQMIATSTGGSITGEGCDYMVIDDPVKPSEAGNDNLRLKSIDFWRNTLSSRFDDKKAKRCIVVMQRLHERDLSGFFIDTYQDCVHLKVPNIGVDRTIYTYPKTGRVKVYEPGEILQPNRENQKALDEAKKELGSFQFAAQRQQDPVPRDGGIFKTGWFKYYDVLPEKFDLVTLSLDCTFKDLETSDYVVLQAWGQIGARHYLIKQLRAKLGFLKTQAALKLWAQELFPNYHEALIEDKANGSAIIETLGKVCRALIPINPQGSKVARATACEPDIEAGDVYLPNPDYNPWVKEIFLPEVCSFPKAANDDQVDGMTQYLNRAKTRKVGSLDNCDDSEDNEMAGETFADSLNSKSTW